MSEKLDERDFAILELLKKDARLSEQKIARKSGIPMTTVHNRIKKLQQTGVIKRYTIKLDNGKLGKALVAYVFIKAINQADQKALLEEIASIPQVCEVAMVTGDFDIFFKARVGSMDELSKIVLANLRKNRHVGESVTMISYETYENE